MSLLTREPSPLVHTPYKLKQTIMGRMNILLQESFEDEANEEKSEYSNAYEDYKREAIRELTHQ